MALWIERLPNMHQNLGWNPPHHINWLWGHTPVTLELRTWRQDNQKFKRILSYTGSLRLVWGCIQIEKSRSYIYQKLSWYTWRYTPNSFQSTLHKQFQGYEPDKGHFHKELTGQAKGKLSFKANKGLLSTDRDLLFKSRFWEIPWSALNTRGPSKCS